jgi:hypothetical protein
MRGVPGWRRSFVERIVRRFAGAAALAAVLQLAVAATGAAWAGLMVYGFGSNSCGDWTLERSFRIGHLVAEQWLDGYLSGSDNETGHDLLNGTDATAATAWVDNYCHSHPLDMVANAADHLIETLEARQGFAR